MNRRHFLQSIAASIAAAAIPSVATAAPKRKPNFVIIFADDQGYQDMGCFGSPLIKTPNMDRLAKEGMRFTDFYSACSVCSPSRAALLTGCYPPRVGLTKVLFPLDTIGLNPQEITIADILKTQGYATICIGKWHVGRPTEFLPTNNGFDSYFGIPYSNDMLENRNKNYPKLPLMENEKVLEEAPDQSQLTRRYTERALRFITENKDQPFFLYLPHTMPHVPLHVSEKFKDTSERGLYGDVIEEIDWSVGEILKTLKNLGLDEDTLVIYTSDNGPWLAKKENGGTALPLRDGKFTTYEGGMREPTAMRWPGTIPAGKTCSELCSTIDLLPTLAGLAGTKPPADRVIDGKDIAPLIKGTPGAKSPHDAFYYYRGTTLEAIRKGKWKLRITGQNNKAKQTGPLIELYDLKADISEKDNLAEKNPNIVARLKKQMEAFDTELKANSRPVGKVEKPA